MQKIIFFKSIVYFQMHLYCVAWGKGAGLLALVCDVYCDFITFPFGILGQVVSIDHSSCSCSNGFTGRTVIIGCTSVFVFTVVCNHFFILQGILDCI